MKSLRATLLLVFLQCLMLRAQAQLVDGIEAIVHETPVTYVEVAELTSQVAENLARDFPGSQAELQKQVSQVRSNNLDTLVARQLILQEFKTFNVPETILDKDVDKRVQEIIHDMYYGDRMKLIKSLQLRGMTFERFRQQIREQFIEIALRQKNVTSEIIISPHKVEAYYQAKREDYKLDDEVKLRMIVRNRSIDPAASDARKFAEEINAKLKDGASFSEMASLYSEGSQAKAGGDWGWYETRKLRKEFAEAAPKLKAGEHSSVIETPEACYIMLVEERKPSRYKTLSEVRDEIEKNLLLEERSRLQNQWIAKLKKKTFVKYIF